MITYKFGGIEYKILTDEEVLAKYADEMEYTHQKQNTINMEEQGILLEEASFKFSQDPNCLDGRDEYESLEIEAHSSLGIDRNNDCFFVLKTEKWSVDGVEDLEKLFNRIRKIVINHGK